jgi:hypothetical protein
LTALFSLHFIAGGLFLVT